MSCSHKESNRSNSIKLKNEEGTLKALLMGSNSETTLEVFCDFLSAKYLKEVKQNFARREGVYSFVSSRKTQKIVDLTAGLGRDLFKFVLAGHDVVGFEQNKVAYDLLKNGVDRFFQNEFEVKKLQALFKVDEFRLDLRFGMATLDMLSENKFDLVYYDPMFLDSSKKAAPKKGMQLLKKLETKTTEDNLSAMLEEWFPYAESFVYKTSSKNFSSRGFPVKPKRVLKGKGFAYVVF